MIAYFSIHNRRPETLACTLIFLLSIFYAAISYEDVYDLAKIEESIELNGEFTEEMYTKWKNEYAHPLVIGHSRRRGEGSQIKRVHEVNNDSEVFRLGRANMAQDNVVQRERNTKLFELSAHPNR